jgi:hypothetical protein
LAIEEYRALRATIRERGTLRLVIGTFTFVVWAALAVISAVMVSTPGPMLIPLLLLAFGFELVNSIHVSVERTGRFLQVYYEDPRAGLPIWETVIMGHRPPSGSGATPVDPLFSGFFIVAAVLNLAPIAVMTAGTSEPMFGEIPVELVVFGVLHLVFALRVIQARRALGTLRQRELDTFVRTVRSKT